MGNCCAVNGNRVTPTSTPHSVPREIPEKKIYAEKYDTQEKPKAKPKPVVVYKDRSVQTSRHKIIEPKRGNAVDKATQQCPHTHGKPPLSSRTSGSKISASSHASKDAVVRVHTKARSGVFVKTFSTTAITSSPKPSLSSTSTQGQKNIESTNSKVHFVDDTTVKDNEAVSKTIESGKEHGAVEIVVDTAPPNQVTSADCIPEFPSDLKYTQLEDNYASNENSADRDVVSGIDSATIPSNEKDLASSETTSTTERKDETGSDNNVTVDLKESTMCQSEGEHNNTQGECKEVSGGKESVSERCCNKTSTTDASSRHVVEGEVIESEVDQSRNETQNLSELRISASYEQKENTASFSEQKENVEVGTERNTDVVSSEIKSETEVENGVFRTRSISREEGQPRSAGDNQETETAQKVLLSRSHDSAPLCVVCDTDSRSGGFTTGKDHKTENQEEILYRRSFEQSEANQKDVEDSASDDTKKAEVEADHSTSTEEGNQASKVQSQLLQTNESHIVASEENNTEMKGSIQVLPKASEGANTSAHKSLSSEKSVSGKSPSPKPNSRTQISRPLSAQVRGACIKNTLENKKDVQRSRSASQARYYCQDRDKELKRLKSDNKLSNCNTEVKIASEKDTATSSDAVQTNSTMEDEESKTADIVSRTGVEKGTQNTTSGKSPGDSKESCDLPTEQVEPCKSNVNGEIVPGDDSHDDKNNNCPEEGNKSEIQQGSDNIGELPRKSVLLRKSMNSVIAAGSARSLLMSESAVNKAVKELLEDSYSFANQPPKGDMVEKVKEDQQPVQGSNIVCTISTATPSKDCLERIPSVLISEVPDNTATSSSNSSNTVSLEKANGSIKECSNPTDTSDAASKLSPTPSLQSTRSQTSKTSIGRAQSPRISSNIASNHEGKCDTKSTHSLSSTVEPKSNSQIDPATSSINKDEKIVEDDQNNDLMTEEGSSAEAAVDRNTSESEPLKESMVDNSSDIKDKGKMGEDTQALPQQNKSDATISAGNVSKSNTNSAMDINLTDGKSIIEASTERLQTMAENKTGSRVLSAKSDNAVNLDQAKESIQQEGNTECGEKGQASNVIKQEQSSSEGKTGNVSETTTGATEKSLETMVPSRTNSARSGDQLSQEVSSPKSQPETTPGDSDNLAPSKSQSKRQPSYETIQPSMVNVTSSARELTENQEEKDNGCKITSTVEACVEMGNDGEKLPSSKIDLEVSNDGLLASKSQSDNITETNSEKVPGSNINLEKPGSYLEGEEQKTSAKVAIPAEDSNNTTKTESDDPKETMQGDSSSRSRNSVTSEVSSNLQQASMDTSDAIGQISSNVPDEKKIDKQSSGSVLAEPRIKSSTSANKEISVGSLEEEHKRDDSGNSVQPKVESINGTAEAVANNSIKSSPSGEAVTKSSPEETAEKTQESCNVGKTETAKEEAKKSDETETKDKREETESTEV